MGKVRNETIKKFARSVIEKYPDKFSQNYENNKKLLGEVADIQSKKLKNKIAGYVTTLVSRKSGEPITEPATESVIPPKEVEKPRIPDAEIEVKTTTEEKSKEEKPEEGKQVEDQKPIEEKKEIKKEIQKEKKLKEKVEEEKTKKGKKSEKLDESIAEKKLEKSKPEKQVKVEKQKK